MRWEDIRQKILVGIVVTYALLHPYTLKEVRDIIFKKKVQK